MRRFTSLPSTFILSFVKSNEYALGVRSLKKTAVFNVSSASTGEVVSFNTSYRVGRGSRAPTIPRNSAARTRTKSSGSFSRFLAAGTSFSASSAATSSPRLSPSLPNAWSDSPLDDPARAVGSARGPSAPTTSPAGEVLRCALLAFSPPRPSCAASRVTARGKAADRATW